MKVFHPGETWLSSEWLFYVERKGIRNAMCDDTASLHLYQHGMDLTLISQWLGHKQLETTLIYAHADTEAKRKAIAEAMASDPFLGAESVNYTVSDEEILFLARRLRRPWNPFPSNACLVIPSFF